MVYLARVNYGGPTTEGIVWIAYDATRVVKGKTERLTLAAWIDAHGRPAGVTRFKGVQRPSEWAMHAGSLKGKAVRRGRT